MKYKKNNADYKRINITLRKFKPEHVKLVQVVEDINCGLHQCTYCDQPDAEFICTQCKSAKYCNDTCQKNDWVNHHSHKCSL